MRPNLLLIRAFILAACSLAVLPAPAQNKAPQPLRILVGFPPGGSTDVLARLVGDAIHDDFSPVTVENRPAPGGRIALATVKAAKPDGQTVSILPSGPMVLFPHVYKKLDYDAVKDFIPISQIARFQFGVVSGPATNVKTVAQMLARGKGRSPKRDLRFAGAGDIAELHGCAAGTKLQRCAHAHSFFGGAPANTALMSGHIGYKFDVVSETAKLHHSGKVRIIAVTDASRDA